MSTCKSFCGTCENGAKTESPEFELLSQDSKKIFMSYYEPGVSSNYNPVSKLYKVYTQSSPINSLQTSTCGNACKQTSQPSTSWRGYIIFAIFGFTVLASIIGVIFAARNKANATKKFNILYHNTGYAPINKKP